MFSGKSWLHEIYSLQFDVCKVQFDMSNLRKSTIMTFHEYIKGVIIYFNILVFSE
jgi:hypothetical protein